MVGGARRGLGLPSGVLRVITLNVNGIRSAASKGLFRWLAGQRADVVCLQEMKCQEIDLDAKLHGLKVFQTCHAFAEKKGYSGVSLYSRKTPDEVSRGFKSREFDAEGRYVEARFGKLWVISLYMPSGSAGPHRQASKFRFLKSFVLHLEKLRKRGHEVILCGDWNIAHREIDLKNWRSNQKNSGFLPEERAWLTRVFDELGFVDVFRRLNDKRHAGLPGRHADEGLRVSRRRHGRVGDSAAPRRRPAGRVRGGRRRAGQRAGRCHSAPLVRGGRR